MNKREQEFVNKSVDQITEMLISASSFNTCSIKEVTKDLENIRSNIVSLPFMTIGVSFNDSNLSIRYGTDIMYEKMKNIDLVDDIINEVNKRVCLFNKKTIKIINTIETIINRYPVKISSIRVADRQSIYIKDFLIKATSAEANIELKYPINTSIDRDELDDLDINVIIDYINSRL